MEDAPVAIVRVGGGEIVGPMQDKYDGGDDDNQDDQEGGGITSVHG